VAERLPCGSDDIRLRIAIADVDAFVEQGSALDAHAAHNTTSVYTGVAVFPMLPEAISCGATSLLEDGERLAVVIEMIVRPDGAVRPPNEDCVYRALVRNHAKLTYEAVGAWLEGHGPCPDDLVRTPGLVEQVRLQDEAGRAAAGAAAQKRRARFRNGRGAARGRERARGGP
jgi:exoribonuclease-2